MFRRKRASARPFMIGGGVVIVAIVVGSIWSLTGTRPADSSPPLISTDRIADAGTGAPKPAAAQPKPEPRLPAAPVVEHTPLVINQGQSGRTGVSPAADAGRPRAAGSADGSGASAPKPPDPAPAHPAPKSEPKPAAPAAAGGAEGGAGIGVPNLPAEVHGLVTAGRQKAAAREPVAARQLLSRALADPRTPEAERAKLREELAAISDDLVFSPRVVADDPFVVVHAVQPGEGLEKIAKRNGVLTHWRLIQRVNRLADPNRIRLNQKLKLVKGPFHAVVSKSAFRMDVYLGPADQPAEWVYVRSFRVGLGEGGGTPTGEFVVRKGSKLENPFWTNPRTGEQFSKDDPKNPIGERWIGLEGVGEAAAQSGYGIHGTIDPDSIGQERSMGCVRLGAQDVELVYDMLGEGVSRVKIVP